MRKVSAPWARVTAAFLVSAMASCATQGARYPEVLAETGAPPEGQACIVLLRPDKRFDNYSLSRAVIRMNDRMLGKLAYGGFLLVDVTAGETLLEASARYRWYGTCALRLKVKVGDTLYVDVAPRPANVAAELVGAAGGAAASAIEGAGKECGGPFRLAPIAAPAALEQLDRLTWSR